MTARAMLSTSATAFLSDRLPLKELVTPLRSTIPHAMKNRVHQAILEVLVKDWDPPRLQSTSTNHSHYERYVAPFINSSPARVPRKPSPNTCI